MGSPESEDWRSNDETQHRVTLSHLLAKSLKKGKL